MQLSSDNSQLSFKVQPMRSFRFLFALTLLVSAGTLYWYYGQTVTLPDSIVIYSGAENGRHHLFSLGLKQEIERRLGINVYVETSQGSLENIHHLSRSEADFIIYQPDTQRTLEGENESVHTMFVANLFSEVVQIIVHPDSAITDARDLAGKRVSMGTPESGDRATSQIVLQHLGLENKVEARTLDYLEVERAFEDRDLDAAILTTGLHSPVFEKELVPMANVRLLSIPYAAALAQRHTTLWNYRIPPGYYRAHPDPVPAEEITTVALRGALLTREDVPDVLVESITQIIMSETFQRDQELSELFTEGESFATSKPEFPMHPGAEHFFSPELKPLLNTDFVEATEGLRSFIVSILVAAWLLMRWLKQRSERSQAHRLDQLIHSIMDIEERQMNLDEEPGGKDIRQLQILLDELTNLRRHALDEFTFHDINDDRSVECFLAMCYSLSEKINAKLTRQRLELALRKSSEASPESQLS